MLAFLGAIPARGTEYGENVMDIAVQYYRPCRSRDADLQICL